MQRLLYTHWDSDIEVSEAFHEDMTPVEIAIRPRGCVVMNASCFLCYDGLASIAVVRAEIGFWIEGELVELHLSIRLLLRSLPIQLRGSK